MFKCKLHYHTTIPYRAGQNTFTYIGRVSAPNSNLGSVNQIFIVMRTAYVNENPKIIPTNKESAVELVLDQGRLGVEPSQRHWCQPSLHQSWTLWWWPRPPLRRSPRWEALMRFSTKMSLALQRPHICWADRRGWGEGFLPSKNFTSAHARDPLLLPPMPICKSHRCF